jgi:hypothetical protein
MPSLCRSEQNNIFKHLMGLLTGLLANCSKLLNFECNVHITAEMIYTGCWIELSYSNVHFMNACSIFSNQGEIVWDRIFLL